MYPCTAFALTAWKSRQNDMSIEPSLAAGKYMLAHAASAQGISAVENMCGREHVLNHNSVPAACFTHPEVSFNSVFCCSGCVTSTLLLGLPSRECGTSAQTFSAAQCNLLCVLKLYVICTMRCTSPQLDCRANCSEMQSVLVASYSKCQVS